MEEMKVVVRWEGDPFWLNPDNLLIALRAYCPNTKFECEYTIHPNKERIKKNTIKETRSLIKNNSTYPILFGGNWHIHAVKFTANKIQNKRADILLIHKELGERFLIHNWKRHPIYHYEIRHNDELFLDGEIEAHGQCEFVNELIPIIEKRLIEIDSIDEIKLEYDHSHEGNPRKLDPEVEFWGHCSNLQAWYENNYDTRILHSNISFPLLKKLMEHGDPKAKRVFKEEIALRFESNFRSVVFYLLKEKYLSHFDYDEIETLSENIDFSKWAPISIKEFLDQWHMKAIKSEDKEKIFQIVKKKEAYINERLRGVKNKDHL